jgi:hypothetical protein
MRNLLKVLFISLFLVCSSNSLAAEYSRMQFTDGWNGLPKSCMDVRDVVLKRDAVVPAVFDKKCKITKGQWLDPYTNAKFTNSALLDIDHIVPLKFAWDHGADKWTYEQRNALANDPENLLAVAQSANRAKGESSPLHWMPANKNYWLTYLDKWDRIIAKYKIPVNQSEKDAVTFLRTKVPKKGVIK